MRVSVIGTRRVDDRHGADDRSGYAHGDAGESDAYADHDPRIGGFTERRGAEAERGNECQRSECTHGDAPRLVHVRKVQREGAGGVDGVSL
jgi:hypothetical protein